jgi:hypothetical protein
MHTTLCRAAAEQLLAYLEDPSLHSDEIEAAFSHMRGCPYCERRIGHLVRVLNADKQDRLACQECQKLLPDYLEAEREAQAHKAQWRSITSHLETCPHCSAEYATLSDLIELAHGERGEEPPDYPVPDLSFFPKRKDRPSEPTHVLWHLDDLGHLIIEFSAELVRTMQPPTHQLAYATARLKSGRSSRTLCQLSIKEAVKDLEVAITAEEAREELGSCTIIVEVNIPSRGGWPNLANTEVTIKRGKMELETQLTDAFGQAVFDGIATGDLAHLVFEIKPSDYPSTENCDPWSPTRMKGAQ